MKRTSFFLPDDLRDRLAAESQRSGVPVAELVRRYLDAMTPPVTVGFGGLRRYVDRQGLLKVFVLSAREGKLLVEPGETGFEGMVKPAAEIWVDASLVTFPETVGPLLNRSIPETPPGLRLNQDAPLDEPEQSTPGDKEPK
jgi:hypothetical protein